jgi:hypothetical protein
VPGRVPQQIAVAFALCAFLVAIGAGLSCSIPPTTILVRALVALIASYPMGRALGGALTAAMNEHQTAIAAANPIPEQIRLGAPPTSGGDVEIIEEVGSL